MGAWEGEKEKGNEEKKELKKEGRRRKKEEEEGSRKNRGRRRGRRKGRKEGKVITQCVINIGSLGGERRNLISNRAPSTKRTDLNVLNGRKTARQRNPPPTLHMFWDIALCGPCATTPGSQIVIKAALMPKGNPPLPTLHMFWDIAICGPCTTTPRCQSVIKAALMPTKAKPKGLRSLRAFAFHPLMKAFGG